MIALGILFSLFLSLVFLPTLVRFWRKQIWLNVKLWSADVKNSFVEDVK